MATLEDVTGWLNGKSAALADLDQSILIDLKGEGFIHVTRDGATNEQKAADLTIRTTLADLVALGERRLDPAKAMFTGRLKLSNMGLAMKMQPILKAMFS
ncbi:SCP2 sterol-binding domain-containing protein [Phenylobacterium immobile]|uniref:SCP2 sterol-binding domain-containing protein n=1 Tax=Phenylobacterium immobile TaxID=21 RepID=UPI000A98D92E|nr:SCP2 sterol-binding domain-containing protein [Phenylobacterium immobile]